MTDPSRHLSRAPRAGLPAMAIAGLALAAGAARADDWRILDPAPGFVASIQAAPTAPATPSFPALDGGDQVAPFILSADSATRDRALDCLTAAIYYEAATEPREGQEAVAQVVLNRLRHPAYPKSVCGVVYDGVGSSRTCQFTFACDGSTSRTPVARLWDNARQVADAALSGHVAARIGAATHYHASYVSPYWRTSMTPVGQIGNHLFYRLAGWQGTPAALTGLYSQVEPTPPAPTFAQATSRRGRPGAAPAAPVPAAPKTVEFTVWGLKMATISVKHGRIDVKSPS